MAVPVQKNQTTEKNPKAGFKRVIYLALDSYDDLFSDFDNRHFNERNLSDDFMDELKKLSTENRLLIDEIRLEMPEKKRMKEYETIIIRRIHAFIKANHQLLLKEESKRKRKGIIFLFSGLAALLITTSFFSWKTNSFFERLLYVILEPSGWFFTWSGMEILFLKAAENKTEAEFFRKVRKSHILFENLKTETDKAPVVS